MTEQFAPRRPRLELARAAVRGIDEGREAWEALASQGVIPTEWVGSDARGFIMVVDHPAERRAPFPPTPAACVAMAADPEGVSTAEELARSLSRLEGRPRERVLWRIVPANTQFGAPRDPPPPEAQESWNAQVTELLRHGYAMYEVNEVEIVLLARAIE